MNGSENASQINQLEPNVSIKSCKRSLIWMKSKRPKRILKL